MTKAWINQPALAAWIAQEDKAALGHGWAIESFDLDEPVEVLVRKMNGKKVAIRQEFISEASTGETIFVDRHEAMIPVHCLILIREDYVGEI